MANETDSAEISFAGVDVPSSEVHDCRAASPKLDLIISKKRKADYGAEEPLKASAEPLLMFAEMARVAKKMGLKKTKPTLKRIKRTTNDASSGKQQKEAEYLLKQQRAYRAGIQLAMGNQPRDLVRESLGLNDKLLTENENKKDPRALRALASLQPTPEQIASLELASSVGPNFLGRTASLTRGESFGWYHRKSNGFTAQDLLLPSADTRDNYRSHDRLTDLSQAELVYMIGHHLQWMDLRGDELLSYSKDPLFLVVHALRRYHEKQGNVTIQFLDRRKAKTVTGEPVAFYNALDLYTIFEVPRSSHWGQSNMIRLHPRKFTQEFLTHGPVLYDDDVFKQARIEDLIQDGLYDIFPEFHAPADHKRAGLYTLQVVMRRVGFPARAARNGEVYPPIYSYAECPTTFPITIELLEKVRRVTLHFRKVVGGQVGVEPPLHAFICFLTFQKRKSAEPGFMEWIRRRYTAQDVLELYTDTNGKPLAGFTTVADNLPGYMQYLDLIRDCIAVFSLPALPDNHVETAHVFQGTMSQSYAYEEVDNKWQKEDVKSEYWCPTMNALRLDSSRRRRKAKAEAKKASTGAQPATSASLVPASETAESLGDAENDIEEAQESSAPRLIEDAEDEGESIFEVLRRSRQQHENALQDTRSPRQNLGNHDNESEPVTNSAGAFRPLQGASDAAMAPF